MPSFNNLDDVKKYIKQNINTIRLTNGETIEGILKGEAKRLKAIITEHISWHYLSYRNKEEYRRRTYGLINSLCVENMVKNGNEVSVRVYFDEKTATHPSLFGGESGFTPILIDQGWEVKKDVWFKSKYMLGYFEGTDFIKSAVDAYNANNQYGFTISVEYHPYSNLNFEA
ncbi:hypothetical protein AGMMS49573_10780 [Endomicrobiia bacterium]|nr:hypothetical protein AGMMS49573_10780 [Endomicrobiia bacterium]